MKGSKIKALIFGFTVSVLCSFLNFSGKCESISGKILRLHIVANSNSYEDQSLKLKVRDEIINKFGQDLKLSGNIAEAEEDVKSKIEDIKSLAIETVHKNGYDYNVDAKITKMFFNARQYNDVTLPAGFYKAVRITIGEAKGKNWWCVMFPPMCLPAAKESEELSEVLSDSELQIVENEPKYLIKFKVYELFLKLKNFIKDEICENFENYFESFFEKIEENYDLEFKIEEIFSEVKSFFEKEKVH